VFNGFDRKQATEFSFLLAVPTMLAASGYDLLKTPLAFNRNELILLSAGLLTAFVSAWIAVKLFLAVIKKSGFYYFGWYRILIGVAFLVLIKMKVI
jgi:undecaprenyl-diphosphatase